MSEDDDSAPTRPLPPPDPAAPNPPSAESTASSVPASPHTTVSVNVGAAQVGRSPGTGSLILNVLWVVFSGFWLFLGYLFAGVIQCITIIGIPFGVQSFKLAGFALWPFGRSVVQRPSASTSLSLVGNIIWIVLSGIWLALAHLVLGVLLCITIIGIPLGLGNFKLIPLALAPFGKDIVRNGTVVGPTVVSF